ncbi:hypothetical protein IQ266_10280 [filamentous cyanobacterium LEGE 11480]|uniref:Uncharacterized protein n=1 Tax=Romeriopsis navalis LEGE 11480 TaxID=2777977 RepID=A0A928VP86_9CYAN|nr:hypothetical protein [Romeriopsis navalis]MBE9030115.1 hypothetical protein [Romeriopsis navalis LEGE 11480]
MRFQRLTITAIIVSCAIITIAPQAQAKMPANYVGGTAAGAFSGMTKTFEVKPDALRFKETDDVEFQSSIDARYRLPVLPISARTSIYLNNLSVQATGTYDLSIIPNVGAYIGGGVHIDEKTTPVVQVGAEAKFGKTVIYGGFDYLTELETGVAKAGFGYSF